MNYGTCLNNIGVQNFRKKVALSDDLFVTPKWEQSTERRNISNFNIIITLSDSYTSFIHKQIKYLTVLMK